MQTEQNIHKNRRDNRKRVASPNEWLCLLYTTATRNKTLSSCWDSRSYLSCVCVHTSLLYDVRYSYKQFTVQQSWTVCWSWLFQTKKFWGGEFDAI